MYDFICKCKNKLKEISGYLTFRSGIDNIHLLLWSSNLSMDVIPPPPPSPCSNEKRFDVPDPVESQDYLSK